MSMPSLGTAEVSSAVNVRTRVHSSYEGTQKLALQDKNKKQVALNTLKISREGGFFLKSVIVKAEQLEQ